MANTVILKKKTNGTGSPSASDLVAGELAINTVDKILQLNISSNALTSTMSVTGTISETDPNALPLAIALG